MSKIDNSSNNTTQHQPMYAPVIFNSTQYTNPQHPLTQHCRVSLANTGLILDKNPVWFVIIHRMSLMLNRSISDDVLESITVALGNDWYNGIVSRNTASQVLSDMVAYNILRRVHPNAQRGDLSRMYYLNPHIAHVLSRGQRLQFMEKHGDMFPQITL